METKSILLSLFGKRNWMLNVLKKYIYTQNLAVRATWCLRFVIPGLDCGPNYTKEPILVQTDTS
jgi:hypothetical protein